MVNRRERTGGSNAWDARMGQVINLSEFSRVCVGLFNERERGCLEWTPNSLDNFGFRERAKVTILIELVKNKRDEDIRIVKNGFRVLWRMDESDGTDAGMSAVTKDGRNVGEGV